MIELKRDALEFSLPEVHREARFRVGFQRTLRIPDDGEDYPLPPGLGRFPLRHVDDHRDGVPPAWIRRGGVMLPMYQAEALWISFLSYSGYPFAVKVAAGKINAVTGEAWEDGIHPDPQDYVALPEQPWLDGYCVEEGVIRQFVAMPLGAGYSAEEQITGKGEHGGLQLVAYPLRAESWERMKEERRRVMDADLVVRSSWDASSPSYDMGLPWFDHYAADLEALEGSETLAGLKSVLEKAREKGDVPLPENESVEPERVVRLKDRRPKDRVREGAF